MVGGARRECPTWRSFGHVDVSFQVAHKVQKHQLCDLNVAVSYGISVTAALRGGLRLCAWLCDTEFSCKLRAAQIRVY